MKLIVILSKAVGVSSRKTFYRSVPLYFILLMLPFLVLTTFPSIACGKDYNVTNYGAKGDGLTNDSAAIQRAIDACPSGGTVTFPEGVYHLGSTVYLKSHVTLQGAGSAQSVLLMTKKTSATALLFGNNLMNATISNIGFKGSGADGKEYGVSMSGVTNCTLEHLRFDHLCFGMKLGAGNIANGWKVRDIVARNCVISLFLASCNNSIFERLDLQSVADRYYNKDHTVYIERDVTNCTFNDWRLAGGRGWALHLYGASYGQGSSHHMTFNNLLIDVRQANYPIIIGDSKYTDIVFNNTTIYANNQTQYQCVAWFYGGRNIVFDNFVATGCDTLAFIPFNDSGTSNISFKNGTFDGQQLAYGDGKAAASFTNMNANETTTTTRPSTTTTARMPTTTTTLALTTTTKAPTTTTSVAPAVSTTTTMARVSPVTTTTTKAPTATTKAPTTTTSVAPAVSTTTTATIASPPSVSNSPQTTKSNVVTISSPANGAVVKGKVEVRLAVSSQVAVGKVFFTVDNRWLAQDYRAPYCFMWNTAWTLPGSIHTITGIAYDKKGREIGRASSQVTVDGMASRGSANKAIFAIMAAGYNDIEYDSPYWSAVCSLSEAGVISGFSDGRIGADQAITRAQFAKMASIAFGIDDDTTCVTPFTDLGPADEYLYPHKHVAALYTVGAIAGISPTDFSPGASLTRAQAITILVRMLEAFEPRTLLASGSGSGASALGDFSSDHARPMAIAEASGLFESVAGYGSDWDPWVPVSRGEVAQLICNLTEGLWHTL